MPFEGIDPVTTIDLVVDVDSVFKPDRAVAAEGIDRHADRVGKGIVGVDDVVARAAEQHVIACAAFDPAAPGSAFGSGIHLNVVYRCGHAVGVACASKGQRACAVPAPPVT
nr:hypothetical protein [Alexandriicola marinus]